MKWWQFGSSSQRDHLPLWLFAIAAVRRRRRQPLPPMLPLYDSHVQHDVHECYTSCYYGLVLYIFSKTNMTLSPSLSTKSSLSCDFKRVKNRSPRVVETGAIKDMIRLLYSFTLVQPKNILRFFIYFLKQYLEFRGSCKLICFFLDIISDSSHNFHLILFSWVTFI